MAGLSISAAWDATHRFVQRECALLLPVSFALIGLPGVVLELVSPAYPSTATAGPWLLAALASWLVLLFGMLAIPALALGSNISVREAFVAAARRLPQLAAAMLLFLFAASLLIAPLLPMLGAAAGRPGAGPMMSPGKAMMVLAYCGALLGIAAVLSARLLPLTAVFAVEPGGAITGIVRSWRLTRGHFWRLLGYQMLLVSAALLLSLAVTTALGSVLLALGRMAGEPELGRLLVVLLASAVNAVVALYGNVMMAMIYRQLAGSSSGT